MNAVYRVTRRRAAAVVFSTLLSISYSAVAAAAGVQPPQAQQPPAQQPPAPARPAGPPDPAADALRAAQQKVRAGQFDEALAAYAQILQQYPNSVQAMNQTGVVLDLMGKYADARQSFTKAIAAATTPQAKAQGLRSMAMSYAFQSDCKGATPYESQLYETYLGQGDYYNAGEIADELARICIESGDLDTAETWYRMGYTAGLQEPGIKPARKDLWDFRWEHAMARLEARRGHKEEAQKHVALAKAALDKGTNPEQAQFLPYLTGYVAFYTGDYKTALDDLLKGNQNDPFILSLIAQTYEKLGNQADATATYKKILGITIHNPTNAFARPLAKKKLGQG